MANIWKSIFILTVVISLQIIVYAGFLRPLIFTWGASENEVRMPMVGDDLAPYISSTRAVTINAPAAEVWKWLTQLGADRGGFFSYTFIEKALGYETHKAGNVLPKNYEMKVGRIIRGSLADEKSVIKYNFPVVYVEPEKAFVLKNWGTFALRKIEAGNTRLIVRTHGRALTGLYEKIIDFFLMPMHYLMERKMLIGIKNRAEAGDNYKPSSIADFLWFLGVALSAVGIILMIFIGRGMTCALVSGLYGIGWLWPLLIVDPKPTYSLALLLLVGLTLVWFFMKKKTARPPFQCSIIPYMY